MQKVASCCLLIPHACLLSELAKEPELITSALEKWSRWSDESWQEHVAERVVQLLEDEQTSRGTIMAATVMASAFCHTLRDARWLFL